MFRDSGYSINSFFPNRNNFQFFVVGILIIVSALSAGSFTVSLWMDDYSFAWGIVSDDPKTIEFIAGSARPVLALLALFGSNISINLAFVSYLKVIGLLGVIFAYITIYHRWVRLGIPPISMIIAAIGLCLPTFQTYTFWGSAFTYSWSLVFSIVSLSLCEQNTLKTKLASVLLYTLAIFLYPPGALFIFGLLAVEIWICKPQKMIRTRIIRSSLTLFLSGIFFFAAVFYTYTATLGITRNHRSQLINLDQIPEKVFWFVSRVVTSSLRPFQISSPSLTELILTVTPLLAFFVMGISIQYRRLKETKLHYFLTLLFLCLLSSLHSLVLEENQFEFRFFPGLFWASLVIALSISIDLINRFVRNNRATLAHGLFLTLLALLVITKTNLTYFEIIKKPFEIKTEFLNTTIDTCLDAPNEFDSIGVIRADSVTRPNLGSFSIVSDSYYDWVLEPEVRLLLQEKNTNRIQFQFYDHHNYVNPKECKLRLQTLIDQIYYQS